jgi:DNA-binding transcriptional MerR regulator
MKRQDHLLSITEMAKLRGITTETLRHYDRIGLLKPDETDENGVRYYSVLKYEQLETIRELRQTGLTLKEIHAYLDHRSLSSSRRLLIRQKEYCEEQVRLYASDNYAGSFLLQEGSQKETELMLVFENRPEGIPLEYDTGRQIPDRLFQSGILGAAEHL